jgi:predicted lipid carrier protein YhbT
MLSLQPSFVSLLNAFPPRPVDQQALQSLVKQTLKDAAKKSTPENRKAQWEYLLRKDIFDLAVCPVLCIHPELVHTLIVGHRRHGVDERANHVL